MKKTGFDKNQSLAIKGVAILMMLFHHLFWNPSFFSKYKISFFPVEGGHIIHLAGSFKICICLFAFVSGYGLFQSFRSKCKKDEKMLSTLNGEQKEQYQVKSSLKWVTHRLIHLLSGFWLIALFCFVFFQLIDGRTYTLYFSHGIFAGILQMLFDFFGLSFLMGTNSLNATWWYMSLAIVFVLIFPFLYRFIRKYGYFTLFVGYFFLFRMFSLSNNYIHFSIAMMIGVFFADKNLLPRIANYKICKNGVLNKLVKMILELIVLYVFYHTFSTLSYELPEIYFGIFPTLVILFFYEFIIDVPIVKQVLQFLGRYSMYIYLIHDFFLSVLFKDLIYSYSHFILCFFCLLGLSLLAAFFFDAFQMILNYSEKMDQLSFKIQKAIDQQNSTQKSL